MSSKNGDNFLSKLAHSQAPRWFFKAAVKGARDDLNDVISKIVSGRIISPGMGGNPDA